MTRVVRAATLAGHVAAAALPAALATAQGTAPDSAGLAVASAAPTTWFPAATSTTAPMQRAIALGLHRATVREALRQIGDRAGVRLWYTEGAIPPTLGTVSLHVDAMPVAQALAEVLQGTGLAAYVSLNGRDVLIRPELRDVLRLMRQQTGTVIGSVTDSATGAPMRGATVSVLGTPWRGVAGGDGRYTIPGLRPGTYGVQVRSLGYAPLNRRVTVPDTGAVVIVTVNFALVRSATKLDEVVTTGAGPQRRVELGNAIATINADSLARTAPITNLTDLLSGRAPNVAVELTSGIVGDGPAIRIRGQNSITASNDPILIIDGVRADPAPGGQRSVVFAFANFPTASRLNDLDPNQIESIEVLRGPSAATEYGTDAANGVIVVKTKRGRSGAARWDVFADQSVSTMPAHFPASYYSWGHTTDPTHTPTRCPLVNFGPNQYAGTCAVDSVTHFQPIDHASTTIFGTGYRGKYELQVAGGPEVAHYFLAGEYANETGPLQMPPAEQARLARERGAGVPENQRRPNALDETGLRGRADLSAGHTLEATVSADYHTNSQRTPDGSNVAFGALVGRGYRDSLSGYGPSTFVALRSAPGYAFAKTSSEDDDRFTDGLAGAWRPVGWLTGRVTLGMDKGNRATVSQVLPGQFPFFNGFAPGGFRSRGEYHTGYYTVDLGLAATAALLRSVTARTTIGAQYVDQRATGAEAVGFNISSTNPSLNGTVVQNGFISELNNRTATLGAYVDEMVAIDDRLFLTGALREDAGSGFGSHYTAALYPKASVSWVVSPESRNLVRLRAAYGQSGVQPRPGAALQLFGTSETQENGRFVAGDTIGTFANIGLKPERSEEIEGGVDVGLWHSRLTLELTAYLKQSHDALIDVPVEGSLGGGTRQENLGSVRNRGLEANGTVRLVDAHAVTWDVTTGGSINLNRLVKLAPGTTGIDLGLSYADPFRQRPGYPVYGLWGLPFRYTDSNHDGRIEPNEVTPGDTAVFVGPSMPTHELAISTALALFGGSVRVAGQLDHRGGNRLANAAAYLAECGGTGRAINDPTAPLPEQARAVECATYFPQQASTGYLEDASFTRLRELSVTYAIPGRLTRAARVQQASLTLAGRNLALWSRYTGPDPEVNDQATGGDAQVIANGVPTPAANHDIAGDYATVPQLRYWVFKINVTF